MTDMSSEPATQPVAQPVTQPVAQPVTQPVPTTAAVMTPPTAATESPAAATAAEVAWFRDAFDLVTDNISQAVLGKRHVVRLALTCLFAEGHLLLEDVPGIGKTMLARAIANSRLGHHARIQFTPDLLPSDVTGVTIYDQGTGPVRVPPRPGLPPPRAGRRDQPRLAEDPVGAARGDGGTPRDR